MASLSELIGGMRGDGGGASGESQSEFWQRVLKASGGTSAGMLELLRSEEPLYENVAAIMALPEHEYETKMQDFQQQVRQSSDPFLPEMFSAWQKCRAKEFASLVRLAMVRAAAEYKLHGSVGLNSVLDPYDQSPFQFSRFAFQGTDRGFELKSAYAGKGTYERLIFVEKDGPPFSVAGLPIKSEKTGPAPSNGK